jgi:hypothetical protein
MAPAALLADAAASIPLHRWNEEDAKLTEAMKKHGTDWVAVAALVQSNNISVVNDGFGSCQWDQKVKEKQENSRW